MEALNLPDFTNQLKSDSAKNIIYDSFRKKHVALTPEEWVRQNFLMFMFTVLNYPAGLLSVEMSIELNKLKRRCDIVAFNHQAQPKLIVECKATSIKINQQTFNQIATYNLKLKVDYLVITNGLEHYCCKMDYKNNTYSYLEKIPKFEELV